MATTIRSTLPVILLNIQAWLQTQGLTGDATGIKFWVGRDMPTPNQADHVVYLWPRGQMVKSSFGDAAGRIDTRVSRKVTVLAFTRLDVDAMDDTTAFLTDPTLGHLVFEHKLYDALECYLPVDGSGNSLVEKPIRLESTAETEKLRPTNGWGLSTAEFDVSFCLALNQARQ